MRPRFEGPKCEIEVIPGRNSDHDSVYCGIVKRLIVVDKMAYPTVSPPERPGTFGITTGVTTDNLASHGTQVTTVHSGNEPTPQECDVKRMITHDEVMAARRGSRRDSGSALVSLARFRGASEAIDRLSVTVLSTSRLQTSRERLKPNPKDDGPLRWGEDRRPLPGRPDQTV